jgi:hypothetical protein
VQEKLQIEVSNVEIQERIAQLKASVLKTDVAQYVEGECGEAKPAIRSEKAAASRRKKGK